MFQQTAERPPDVPASASVIFTDNAAAKVSELIAEERNPNLKLRISVAGGGCAGLKYNFAFDETTEAGDAVFAKGGATLLIDSRSMPYLKGAEIDYAEGLEGSRFVIKNPNATSTCSCGSSFCA
jgi:iron-sulfur cluster insertion protein